MQCLKGEVNSALPASVFCSLQKQNIFRSNIIAATLRYTTEIQSCLLGGEYRISSRHDMYKQTSVVDPDPSSPYDLGLLDPDSDPQVRGTDPDPSQAK